jgi:hypothetical protein
MRLDPPGQTLTRCPNPAPGASHETIVWIALASMIACAKEPAPVDIVEINRLSALRDSVGQELKDLVAESGESASSVIGALRGSRHEALATTDAFLRQRIEALRGGVTFRHSETSPPIDTRAPTRSLVRFRSSVIRSPRSQPDSARSRRTTSCSRFSRCSSTRIVPRRRSSSSAGLRRRPALT